MKKNDDPLHGVNKWFRTGNIVINLDWIAFIKFEEVKATIYLAAQGKRKFSRITLNERDSDRLQEVFAFTKEE